MHIYVLEFRREGKPWQPDLACRPFTSKSAAETEAGRLNSKAYVSMFEYRVARYERRKAPEGASSASYLGGVGFFGLLCDEAERIT